MVCPHSCYIYTNKMKPELSNATQTSMIFHIFIISTLGFYIILPLFLMLLLLMLNIECIPAFHQQHEQSRFDLAVERQGVNNWFCDFSNFIWLYETSEIFFQASRESHESPKSLLNVIKSDKDRNITRSVVYPLVEMVSQLVGTLPLDEWNLMCIPL